MNAMSSHNRAQKSVQSPVAIPPNVIAQRVLPCATGTDGSSKDLQMGERLTHCQEEWDLCQATANKLTDDALLDIFDFFLNDNIPDGFQSVDEWHTLVHVCRRWRDLVFASPRRLNLRLHCRKDTPVREMLDIWPALPIEIGMGDAVGLDNIVAALEHPDRVRSIELDNPTLGALATALQVPFPELTHLNLFSTTGSAPVLPDSFLGGSAPRLRTLHLDHIQFPALPNLLLSASDLVHLTLWSVLYSGYPSPEVIVACLSSLNRLEYLRLHFKESQSYPDQPNPPPQTRIVLPALTSLSFKCITDYSEDFLARIDTPVLNNFSMSFFTHLTFDVPHFIRFIDRTEGLKPPKAALVLFSSWSIQLQLEQHLVLEINCNRIGRHVDSMATVCSQLSLFLSLIEQLNFADNWTYRWLLPGEDHIESTEFLELLRPFTAVRSLYVSRDLVPPFATGLQELIGPSATEVLPNLCDLFLGGSAMPGTVPEAIQPFVTARELSGQPVAVHDWEGGEADSYW